MSAETPSLTAARQTPAGADASLSTPLCVDLDGTLINTDCLWESAAALCFRDFPKLAGIVARGWHGRAWIKRQLGFQTAPDALPFNAEVMAMIHRERAAGRKILLVTASDQAVADAIAAHLNIFDEAIGSDGVNNLRGAAKAAYLVKRFGRGGYDYMGDSSIDIPVWESARHAYAVRPSAGAKEWLAGGTTPSTEIGGNRRHAQALLDALRPRHWVKNILVFLPLLTAHLWREPEAWSRLVSFFFALCFGASAIYLINDLADVQADRRHRIKCRRPVASGELPIPNALLAIPACLVAAIACCLRTGWPGVGLVAGYVVATTAYSFALKKIPILDILLLSGFYVFRIAAGAVLAPVTLSPWLIAFAMFLFLSLAAAKRYVELTQLTESRPVNASRGYLREDFPIIAALGVNTGCLAVLVLGLYVNSDTFHSLYSGAPVFWLLCPLLLYWLLRIWLLAGRKQLHEDPVLFALRDGVTWVIAALGALVFYCAMAGHFR